MISGKTVLVTGATGLIGSALVRRLREKGAKVTSAVRDPKKADGDYVIYDANAPIGFDIGFDCIVHAACSAHPMAYSTDPVGTMKANILGTMNLLEYAVKHSSRLLFISSGEIYGSDAPDESGFKENHMGVLDTLNPRSCYPESKRAAETLVASYVKQYGADALVARCCHVYGEGITKDNSRADAQFLRNAVSGSDIVMKSAGAQVRSFMYADDCADALITLLEKGEKGEAYNVAGRTVASIADYARTLAQLAGVKVVFEDPDAVEKAGYTAVTRAVLDPSKLESLGFSAKYDLRSGLAETIKRWRTQN